MGFLLSEAGKVWAVELRKEGRGPPPLQIPIPESVCQLAVSGDGSQAAFRSKTGQVWYAGAGLECEEGGAVGGGLRERASHAHPRRVRFILLLELPCSLLVDA